MSLLPAWIGSEVTVRIRKAGERLVLTWHCSRFRFWKKENFSLFGWGEPGEDPSLLLLLVGSSVWAVLATGRKNHTMLAAEVENSAQLNSVPGRRSTCLQTQPNCWSYSSWSTERKNGFVVKALKCDLKSLGLIPSATASHTLLDKLPDVFLPSLL